MTPDTRDWLEGLRDFAAAYRERKPSPAAEPTAAAAAAERAILAADLTTRLHAEGEGPEGHLPADPPHAHDADRLAEQLAARLPLPAADMVAALKSGRVRGYGTDVLDEEPPPAGHPLKKLSSCIITPPRPR